MADIEDQAEAWVRENYGPGQIGRYIQSFEEALQAAYLAGAAQAQADYLAWARSQGWL